MHNSGYGFHEDDEQHGGGRVHEVVDGLDGQQLRDDENYGFFDDDATDAPSSAADLARVKTSSGAVW